MNKKQIKWAQSHDWYIETLPDNTILVEDTHSAGFSSVLRFDNFNELQQWAGY